MHLRRPLFMAKITNRQHCLRQAVTNAVLSACASRTREATSVLPTIPFLGDMIPFLVDLETARLAGVRQLLRGDLVRSDRHGCKHNRRSERTRSDPGGLAGPLLGSRGNVWAQFSPLATHTRFVRHGIPRVDGGRTVQPHGHSTGDNPILTEEGEFFRVSTIATARGGRATPRCPVCDRLETEQSTRSPDACTARRAATSRPITLRRRDIYSSRSPIATTKLARGPWSSTSGLPSSNPTW
jgi:hypothetical protein